MDNFENNIIPITIKYVKNCKNFRIGYGHVDGGKKQRGNSQIGHLLPSWKFKAEIPLPLIN